MLGTFSHVSKSGTLIFRGKDFPPLYADVFTKNGEKVGKVVDIIGPISNPYFVIKPEKGAVEKALRAAKGEGLFVSSKKEEKRRRSLGKKGRIRR
ncbi:H/ACA ribonucleoprotein complex subunit GAR1 [Candidatus Pyrohabitans sp.]